ncbi:hypothetical protein LTR28_005506 [Elasticomyces elasticus]|nr:hypothetical protein LTR28_005506 [Elasticomyces elasticus]
MQPKGAPLPSPKSPLQASKLDSIIYYTIAGQRKPAAGPKIRRGRVASSTLRHPVPVPPRSTFHLHRAPGVPLNTPAEAWPSATGGSISKSAADWLPGAVSHRITQDLEPYHVASAWMYDRTKWAYEVGVGGGEASRKRRNY